MLKKKLKYIIKKVLFKEMPKVRLKSVTETESFLMQELRNEVQDIQLENNEQATSSEAMWNNNIKQLKNLILNQDPRAFLTWKVIKRTMFVETPFYILSEYRYLKNTRDIKGDWASFIKESDIGAPSKYYSLGGNSGNLIHHAYHIAIFQDKTNVFIPESDFILEFGGGYGSMCRLVHQMKFNKKYIIFDLPMFSALQKYYLKSLDLPVLTINEFLENEKGVLCLSSFSDLELVISKSKLKTIKSTFLATWSLSETPMVVRNKIKNLISDFNYYLIAYQLRFGEVDNTTYFDDMSAEMPDIEWQDWNIQHMKGSRYLVGS